MLCRREFKANDVVIYVDDSLVRGRWWLIGHLFRVLEHYEGIVLVEPYGESIDNENIPNKATWVYETSIVYPNSL